MEIPKIYLDNCCYNRPFDSQTQIKIHLESEAKLYIQAGIRAKKYLLLWSYVLDMENSDNPYEEKRNSIALWKKIAVDYCSASDEILLKGREIMKLGIRPKDSLHIACAIHSGCEYFITTDTGLTNKKVTGITIMNPIDFVRELGDMS